MIKIRLQRHGKKHYPFYFIVVANSKSPRNGKFLEKLGTYNPHKKTFKDKININKIKNIKKWIKKGAQPTITIKSILKKLNI